MADAPPPPAPAATVPAPRAGGASEKAAQDRRRLARQVDELASLVLAPIQRECPALASASGVPSIAAWPRAAGDDGGGGGGVDTSGGGGDGGPLDWERLPASCDPGSAIRGGAGGGAGAGDPANGGGADDSGSAAKAASRARRKRLQVESFAAVLASLLGPPPGRAGVRVVDFGSGTGNLLLPLAAAWRACEWVAVEMKPHPLRLLRRRADEARLANVATFEGMIEDWRGSFDVALALHACGNATDRVLQMAVARRAAYVCSPCCVGKLKFSMAGGTSFHPRLQSYTPQQAGDNPAERLPLALALERQQQLQRRQQREQREGEQAGGQAAREGAAAGGGASQAAAAAGGSSGAPSARQREPPAEPRYAAGAEAGGSGGGGEGGGAFDLPPLRHPRSEWLRRRLPDPERHFRILARVADIAHAPAEQAGLADALRARAHVAAAAKAVIELDRNAAAEEEGYACGLFRVLGAEEMAKGDIIVGVPGGGGGCGWNGGAPGGGGGAGSEQGGGGEGGGDVWAAGRAALRAAGGVTGAGAS